MVSIKWQSKPVPKGMKVSQVYGLVFTQDGRFLMRVTNKKSGKKSYNLAGGTPESFDKDMEATLRREMKEEVNTTLQQKLYYVGYQEIDEHNGKPPYAQVRMTALIDKIGEKQPDPDNGETYDRLLVNYKKAIELLNWGDVAKQQIERAAEIAQKELGVDFKNELKEEWV